MNGEVLYPCASIMPRTLPFVGIREWIIIARKVINRCYQFFIASAIKFIYFQLPRYIDLQACIFLTYSNTVCFFLLYLRTLRKLIAVLFYKRLFHLKNFYEKNSLFSCAFNGNCICFFYKVGCRKKESVLGCSIQWPIGFFYWKWFMERLHRRMGSYNR